MIKRKIFNELLEHLPKKEITLIVGPRQVGKTTLMRWIEDRLIQDKKKTIFLNLDYDHDRTFFKSHDELIVKLKLTFGTEYGFVFIDEIQRKENAGLFLKGLYDLDLPYKFIVSGSGSLELKEKIHESLAGRKRLFEVEPVNFEEFVNFKTGYQYEDRLSAFFAVEKNRTGQMLNEYLRFGGYPRVVVGESLEEKTKEMTEIVRSYLDKDIAYFFKQGNTEAFRTMITLLGSQNGQLVNFSKLSSLCGVSLPTVKKYLWYAEKTFAIYAARPFFRNVRKEITKSPIYYFTDLGFCNHALNTFGQPLDGNRVGFLFQNFIANNIQDKLRFTGQTLGFWRTTDKAEVDFVVRKGVEVLPIEVKYSDLKKPEVTRSLRSFIGKYSPQRAFVVNLGLKASLKIDKTTVRFIPFHFLLTEKNFLT
ncbi:ATP-binding protein [Candidatus Peregrinibacteria bacterium]|nr:ATP-binding protein [Candidatus Peregrinibacteria bacterium]